LISIDDIFKQWALAQQALIEQKYISMQILTLDELPTFSQVKEAVAIQIDNKDQLIKLLKVLDDKGWRWASGAKLTSNYNLKEPIKWILLWRAGNITYSVNSTFALNSKRAIKINWPSMPIYQLEFEF
jgi:hypothetical protein